MSGTIYNHRSLQPTGPPTQGPAQSRLDSGLETIRQEFDTLTQELSMMRAQRDEYEAKIASQVNELNIIRQSLYDLETQHGKIRQHYEEEIARARAESRANVTGGIASLGSVVGPGGPPGGGPLGALGGGAGAGPSTSGPGGLSGAPGSMYNSDPYYPRQERDRDRMERERDRDRIDRERLDRDRDIRLPERDPKRMRADKIALKPERPDHFSPSLGPGPTPKLPPPPSSQGPGVGPGLPPPPSQTGSSSHAPYPPAGPSSSHIDGNTLGLINNAPQSFPDELDVHNMPPEFKKEGSDWFAMFNPKVKRTLDVNLVHTLMHESVVCCVRFSADGKYLATGCNRTAQIYDTKTGVKTCVLADESAGKAGDLYIRSVCFSPDGKYLATGAEDKQIRIWDIAKKRIRNIFDGHQQEIYSLDFSADGRLIVSGSGDKTARIWDMHDGTTKVLTINDTDSLNNDAGVTSVAISPNGCFVAAGSLDTVVRIWDVATGNLVERLKGHRDSVYSVAFTPDGKGLVSGSLDKTLKYWDVSGLVSSKGRKENGALGPGSSGAIVKRDGSGSVGPGGPGGPGVGGASGDLKGSQCTMNFTGHKDYVLSVAVSHDGNYVVSGSKDRCVQFWDARSAQVQCMLQGHKNSVISIDLSPAGNVLATGSGDWQARIWSYSTTSSPL